MAMMYEGVNEVRLLGKICYIPSLKEAHGHKYLRTVVVVKENQSIYGEPSRIKTYHPIMLLDDFAQRMHKNLKVGMLVFVRGRLNHYYQSDTHRMSDVLVNPGGISIIAKENPEDVEDKREPIREVDEEWLEQYDNVVPITKYRFYINEDPDMPF